MHMGDYIVIEHQIGPFEFACESVSTGTPFIARIDDDKHRDLSGPHIYGSAPDCLQVSPARWRSYTVRDPWNESLPV